MYIFWNLKERKLIIIQFFVLINKISFKCNVKQLTIIWKYIKYIKKCIN